MGSAEPLWARAAGWAIAASKKEHLVCKTKVSASDEVIDLDNRTPVRRNTDALVYAPAPGRPGVETALLFGDSREEVRMERWQPNSANSAVTLDLPGGGEFLVLDGAFDEGGESFALQSWLRLPPGGRLSSIAGAEGCTVWVKIGHLRHIQVPPSARE